MSLFLTGTGLMGAPFSRVSINNGFLKAKNNEKMQFYLMWANHDVKKNYWNHYKYDSDSLLWTGSVDQENYRIIVDRVIDQIFSPAQLFQDRWEPVFSIFNFHKFVEDCRGAEREPGRPWIISGRRLKGQDFRDCMSRLLPLGGMRRIPGYYEKI